MEVRDSRKRSESPPRETRALPNHPMTTTALDKEQRVTEAEKRFEWPLCYDAENFILGRIEAFTERNSFARTLATRMRDETGRALDTGATYAPGPL